MPRWLAIAALVLCVAYGVGWISNAVLNDDPCVTAYGPETSRYDDVDRWFPARTDCRITAPGGASRIEAGSPEVFVAMSGLTLVVGIALVSRIALVVRAAATVVAGAAAFLVIFIV